MTILWGDNGKVAYGTLKTITISPYVSESTLSGTIVATAKGTTPDVTYTLSSSTDSNISPIPKSYIRVPIISASGQNTSGGAVTVSYQINKNGSSVKTGSVSVANNTYYTVHYNGTGVAGDVFDVYLWVSNASVSLIYSSLGVLPSQIDMGCKIVSQLTFTTANFPSSLTLTTKTGSNQNSNIIIYPSDSTSASFSGLSFSPFQMLYINQTKKIYALNNGDAVPNTGTIQTSATNYPFIFTQYYPTKITYREVLR